jgi:hypothetical protein
MSADEGPIEELDIQLRPADAVARRFIILSSVVQRIVMDAGLDADAYGTAFDLREWLRAEGLWEDATDDERAILTSSPGGISPDHIAELGNCAESLATLAWSLALVERPVPDEFSNLFEREDGIPGPWEKTAPWVAAQSLRPEPVIAVARELAELWSWRYQIESVRRMAQGRELMDIERTIREVTHEATSVGLLKPGKKGGFADAGVPVTHMDPLEVEELAELQVERLTALNWICGYGEDWDSVPLDV